MQAFLVVLTLALVGGTWAAPRCPCSDQKLCDRVTLGERKELFVFQVEGRSWEQYDWSHITTLATFGDFDPQMVCKAHANNARFVYGVAFNVTQLYNLSATSEWIVTQYKHVLDTFADGINIDIEDPLSINDGFQLTEFVQNTTDYFHELLPNSQVTFDVAWSPNCIDGRCYDYAGLASGTDFLVMMDYDLRSQVFGPGPCLASANSPPYLIQAAIQNYTKLGINATQKLALGVPWYGYDYPCIDGTPKGEVCVVPSVPFRGANCSDAAATPVEFRQVSGLFQYTSTGLQWNSTLETPWFNYVEKGSDKVHQVWFDNPDSIKVKVAMAKQDDLRGVSMWTGDFVDYTRDPTDSQAFWDAMNGFFDD